MRIDITNGRMNSDVDREYWASMTHGEKVGFVAEKGTAASFAYSRLELHLAQAQEQMTRIQNAIAESANHRAPEPQSGASQQEMRAYMRSGKARMQPVFREVHLYFVAWACCRNMLQILVGQPGFLEAKKIFDGHLKQFEHYVAGRNSFEHFHDRLPGQRDESRMKDVQSDPSAGQRRIYAGFSKGKYIHSNLSWDISPTSLEQLQNAIAEILAVIHRTIDEEFDRKFMSA